MALDALMKLRGVIDGRARCAHEQSGQMSVELAVVFPIAIALMLIVVNALDFMGACASFDRVARNAIRLSATAPGYGEDQSAVLAAIEEVVSSEAAENVSYSVAVAGGFLGQVTYTATLEYTPTLFGLPLRETVFGVTLPKLRHEVALTVDPYHPGILL